MKHLLNLKFINFVWFQAIWFLAILTQYQYFWLIALLVVGHFVFMPRRQVELITVLPVAMVGCMADIALTLSGVFHFTSEISTLPIPFWLVALWIGFAATLRHSLGYLQNKLVIAGVLGAISGPLSYFAGYRFDAVDFPLGLYTTLPIISVVWALLLPASLYFVSHLADELVEEEDERGIAEDIPS